MFFFCGLKPWPPILGFDVSCLAHSENGRGYEHFRDLKSEIGDKVQKYFAEVAALSNNLQNLRLVQQGAKNNGFFLQQPQLSRFSFELGKGDGERERGLSLQLCGTAIVHVHCCT